MHYLLVCNVGEGAKGYSCPRSPKKNNAFFCRTRPAASVYRDAVEEALQASGRRLTKDQQRSRVNRTKTVAQVHAYKIVDIP